MAWKCKECGGEIIGNAKGIIQNGYGIPLKDGRVHCLEDLDIDFKIYSFSCQECDSESSDLEEIAEWVE